MSMCVPWCTVVTYSATPAALYYSRCEEISPRFLLFLPRVRKCTLHVHNCLMTAGMCVRARVFVGDIVCVCGVWGGGYMVCVCAEV